MHDLRSTAATLAAQQGAIPREQVALLGHTTPGMSLHYQAKAPGRDAACAGRLNDAMLAAKPRAEGSSEKTRATAGTKRAKNTPAATPTSESARKP